MIKEDPWKWVLSETQDDEKEYIRYLSKDIAFLKELREEYREDWEMELLISSIIHDESILMDDHKRRWLNADGEKKELERICRARSGDQQSRNGNSPGSGNTFMDKSQVPDAEPR